MSRKAVRELKREVGRAEARRVRRGREQSRQSGQGHGERTVRSVGQSNLRPTFAQRLDARAARAAHRRLDPDRTLQALMGLLMRRGKS